MDQFKQLEYELGSTNRKAYAEGSRRNLRIQVESFLLFCLYFSLRYLPASTKTLQLYTQFLGRSFKSVESIRNYISGVKTFHSILGYGTDHINNFLINLSLKGLAKEKLHLVKKAEPITPGLLLKLFDVFDLSNCKDVVFWCLFLFSFFLLARKSNLVPTIQKDMVNPKFLLSKDVSLTDFGLLVKFKWSKTIQYGERVLLIPLVKIENSVLCPVKAYNDMLRLIPRDTDSPLFLLKSGKPVFYSNFQTVIKKKISQLV